MKYIQWNKKMGDFGTLKEFNKPLKLSLQTGIHIIVIPMGLLFDMNELHLIMPPFLSFKSPQVSSAFLNPLLH